ncbi:MAG: OsmC family protein [Acidobacteriota bacterium]
MEVLVNHLGDVQFEIKARKHTVYCDQPVEAGGYDEGMTPPEFFLGSIGACAGHYAAEYAKSRKLLTAGMQIRVTAEKVKGPARLDDITIEVHYPGVLEEQHREGLLRAVHTCLIHNTLLNPPKITTKIVAHDAALAA